PVRDHGDGPSDAAAARGCVRRAHRSSRHAGPPRAAGSSASSRGDPGLLARDHPGERALGRLPAAQDPERPQRPDRRVGAREADRRGRRGVDAHQPQHPRHVRGGDRARHGGGAQHRWARLLRRGEPQRDPRTMPSGRHGVRHRAHQHAQDLRHAARWGRAGRAGGRGAARRVVTGGLVRSLRVPRIERGGTGAFRLESDAPDSIGRMHGFLGNFGVLVRAYAYVFLHGRDGLKAVAERAVLNANYLAERVKGAFPLAYPDGRPMHEFVATARPLKEETGIRAMDVAKRVIDLVYHPSTVYFPLVVDEELMVEPTETETKESLDAFANALLRAFREAPRAPGLRPGGPGA